jgi:hypothetical protein
LRTPFRKSRQSYPKQTIEDVVGVLRRIGGRDIVVDIFEVLLRMLGEDNLETPSVS